MIPNLAYVLEEKKLIKNLELFDQIQRKTGARILVALKGYALWNSFDLIGKYLYGAAASGLYEAKLAREEMNKEVHTFSPAITSDEIDEIAKLSDYLIFNSFNQLNQFRSSAQQSNKNLKIGLRINPKYSEVTPDIYNPCVIGSRLGIIPEEFRSDELDSVSGLHFHTHCEQNSDALERTIPYVEKHFGDIIKKMSWVNMGGGHHITRSDYDVQKLIDTLNRFHDKFGAQIYLEPGEAVGWQTGYLQCNVVDIVKNGIEIAILSASAAAHMPDVLEMPYRPAVRGAGEAGEKKYNYRLGGPTCLAGDVIGDYSFDEPLKIGDRIIFEDMIHYTMVKNNAFNGVGLPAIGVIRSNGQEETIKEFGYSDYKMRLS